MMIFIFSSFDISNCRFFGSIRLRQCLGINVLLNCLRLLFFFYLLLSRLFIRLWRISLLLGFWGLILLFLFGSTWRLLLSVSFFVWVFPLCCVIRGVLGFWLFGGLLLRRNFLLIFRFLIFSCWSLWRMIICRWFRFISSFSCIGLRLICCMFIFFGHLLRSWPFLMRLFELI